MTREGKRIVVVPCSGIGKSYGTVAREAAFDLTEDVRPGQTRLVSLSKLVLGVAEARAAVEGNDAVTIDGCPKACAAKMVKSSGGIVAREVATHEVFKRHPTLKPEGIVELNEAGRKLARVVAEEVAVTVDELVGRGDRQANSRGAADAAPAAPGKEGSDV